MRRVQQETRHVKQVDRCVGLAGLVQHLDPVLGDDLLAVLSPPVSPPWLLEQLQRIVQSVRRRRFSDNAGLARELNVVPGEILLHDVGV